MASDSPPQTMRAAARVLIFVAGLLVLLAVAGGWLFGSEHGARTAASAARALIGERLQLDGLHGRLVGPLRIERLTLERSNDKLTFTDVRLDWRPQALWAGRLHLTSLRVGHLAVVHKIEQQLRLLRLPDNISLPVKLRVDQVKVDGGDINWGPITLVRLGEFAFNLDFDGARYRLELERFSAASALERTTQEKTAQEKTAPASITTAFNGQLTLSTVKPYALQGSFSSRSDALLRQQEIGATGQITLSGSLAELATALDLSVNQAQIEGHALLRPFSTQPLGAAQLTAQALDLRGFDASLPQTALDITLSAAQDGTGELVLNNAAAGLYNERKVPVSALQVAFHQQQGQFLFDRITATLGSSRRPAGALSGDGRFADGALTLVLRTAALDLQRLDSRLRATKLAGEITLRHAGGKQEFKLSLSEPLGKQRMTLAAQGRLADTELTIDRAELQAGSGRIQASGHLALSGRQDFRAQGKVSRFRLADIGHFPQAPSIDLNGDFSLHGARQPQLEAELAFKVFDSKLAGQPLLGEGQAQLRADRLMVPKLLLSAGANRLSVQGQLSQRDAQLSFMLSAPQLAQLGPSFGGSIEVKGTVRGTFAQPRVLAEWSAGNLRTPGQLQIASMQGKADIGIDRGKPFFINTAALDMSASGLRSGAQLLAALSAQLQFSPQPNAPLSMTVRAEGWSGGQLRADQFNASVTGTTAQHTIDAALIEPGQKWTLKAYGGLQQLQNAPRWQGNIQAADAAGRFVARLTAPAALLLSQKRVQLNDFSLDTDSGRFVVEQFARDADGLVTRGRIEQLQLARLLQHIETANEPAAPIKTTLQLSGEWDVNMRDSITGTIRMGRDSGDVTMLGSAPVTLGLRSLTMRAAASNGQLTLQFQADGSQLGRIELNANINTDLRPHLGEKNRRSIAPNAVVSGAAHFDVPSLGAIAPLLSPTLIADGRLQGDIKIGGTFGTPRLAGQVAGSALRLSFTDLGLDLRQGELQGDFQDDQLIVRNLSFQSEGGRMVVSGPINFSEGKAAAQLSLNAQRYALLNRADRKLVISGDSQIRLRDNRVAITGAIMVDSGFFDIGRADRIQLSDDVVIAGRDQKPGAKVAAALDMTVALGDGVRLKGEGLDAALVGSVRVLSAAGGTLQAQGSLNVAKGTYTAYGRELAIERGVLRFSGALNNPALDLLAMRRNQQVEAGVSVRGTVLAPRVTLVSEPVVPDAEKLSWLVLGRGLGQAGDADLGALQNAAGALLSQSAAAGVQSRIASAFGLDDFSIGTSHDGLQQGIITLGKQISSRLYVSYQQGLESAASVVQFRYTLSPRLSLEAEAGVRSALSLFYNISFD